MRVELEAENAGESAICRVVRATLVRGVSCVSSCAKMQSESATLAGSPRNPSARSIVRVELREDENWRLWSATLVRGAMRARPWKRRSVRLS